MLTIVVVEMNEWLCFTAMAVQSISVMPMDGLSESLGVKETFLYGRFRRHERYP
jgi:hypothetical protein